MLRIILQQCKLLVGAISYRKRQRLVGPPKIFGGEVIHSITADELFRAFRRLMRFARPRPAGLRPSPPRSVDRAASVPRTRQATAAVLPALLALVSRSRAQSLRSFFRSYPESAHNSSPSTNIITPPRFVSLSADLSATGNTPVAAP